MLDEAGIDVIWDENPKTMHHKFFIIDNTTTITGSYNPTKHANTANDENILIIHNENISNAYVNEFYEMWDEWQLITLRSLSNLSTTSCVSFDLAVAFYGLTVYGLYSLHSKDKEKIYEN
jgi:phosphatidylserine/phosphatidylglycerophosphate/cardiolipin synthase-like enzyme